MRVLHLATILAVVVFCGCQLGPVQDAQFSLRLTQVVPDGTEGFRFSAFTNSTCPVPGRRALGGSVSGDLDNEYVARNSNQLFPLEVGDYVFEALAVDGELETAMVLASGCTEGTIRADQTSTIDIELLVAAWNDE